MRGRGDGPRPARSLRTRLTLWAAGGSVAILVVSALFVSWLVRDSVTREMASLSEEELAELTYLCAEAPLTAERFAAWAEELDRSHPEVDVVCRVWSGSGTELIGSGGSRWLGEELAAGSAAFDRAASDWADRAGPSQHHATARIDAEVPDPDGIPSRQEVLLELFLDGKLRFDALQRIASRFLIAVLFLALATTLGGALFARGVARALAGVAASAQVARLDDDIEPTASPDAPREIQEVVSAIGESLSNMREDHARNVLLTAGLAHELRSPLQNMISENEIALLRKRTVEEYERVLEQQLSELREFALVVDNLVTMTALRDTRHLPRRERFDLGTEAALRLERESELAERRGVLVDLDQSGDMGIEGDREALVLMLRNLVANAVRWTAPNTTVSVLLEGAPDTVTLQVDDAGPGVPEESRERIFGAFHQETAPWGERSGYGLGLALARAAARAHGGDISVSESESGGARFTVTIARHSSGDA